MVGYPSDSLASCCESLRRCMFVINKTNTIRLTVWGVWGGRSAAGREVQPSSRYERHYYIKNKPISIVHSPTTGHTLPRRALNTVLTQAILTSPQTYGKTTECFQWSVECQIRYCLINLDFRTAASSGCKLRGGFMGGGVISQPHAYLSSCSELHTSHINRGIDPPAHISYTELSPYKKSFVNRYLF